ncbi:MAG: hypothetical protein K2K84_00915, partial [Muribaculaceae bacterium]|nr:hypothetical protein [Muribaculaceae bacterium]
VLTLTGFSNTLGNRIIRVTNGDKEVMAFINSATGGVNKTVGGASTVLNSTNCQLITASEGFTPRLNGTAKSVSVTVPANGFAVFATTNTAGVDDIVVDGVDNDAPVEYFNLQGVKVDADSAAPGVYVRRQGSTTSKVIVR